jgi:Uma2 family endonuclease
MPDVEQPERLTLEEYEALNAVAPYKLEYRDGRAVALAVPARIHSRIVKNLVEALGLPAQSRGCDYYAGDAKVITPIGDRLIPDFLITCDARDQDLAGRTGENFIRYPRLVVEVLSPDSRNADLGEKCASYLSIEELEWYVLIETRSRGVIVFERRGNDFVRHAVPEGAASVLFAGEMLPLDALYGGV